MTAVASRPLPIPFVPQPHIHRERMCGAASLAMVYRFWTGAQPGTYADEQVCQMIWSRIAVADLHGGRFARCHRLAADLCHAGIPAAALQACQPWEALFAALEAGLPTIVNFQQGEGSPWGHFAVATAIDDDEITLHDPQHGPDRVLARSQFLNLWDPREPHGEIVGRALIVAARPPGVGQAPAIRWLSQHCAGCERSFPMPPDRRLLAAIVGAFCPWCERGWQIRLSSPERCEI